MRIIEIKSPELVIYVSSDGEAHLSRVKAEEHEMKLVLMSLKLKLVKAGMHPNRVDYVLNQLVALRESGDEAAIDELISFLSKEIQS